MGRCNPVAERWSAPPDPFVRPNEKKTNQIYVSYAAATAGIRLHIPRAPPEKLAAMLTNDCKPSHGIKPSDCYSSEKHGSCIPLSSPFFPSRNGVKSRYDSMNGANRPLPPKPRYVDAQPNTPPPPYSDSVPPRSTANMNLQFQGPKPDAGESQQFTNARSSRETHPTNQVNKVSTPETTPEAGPTIDETTTVELQVHTTQSSVNGFAKIKIEEEDTKEADFKISGVGNVAGAPILVSHHSVADFTGDTGDLENYAKCSNDPTYDQEEFTEQPIPGRSPSSTALSDLLVQHLLANPVDRLSKIVQMMVKYSRMLQNLRNHNCQQPSVPSDIPMARFTSTSPHTWGIRKWLALGSILLYYSLGQGSGEFGPRGFASTSNPSQTAGSPNTPLGDIGGDTWPGRGPGFEDLALLGQESRFSLEELFGSLNQVPDVLARPPYGLTSHLLAEQFEPPPTPPPPLSFKTPCAKSYCDGFNAAIAMMSAACQAQAPSTQLNPMAMNETQTSHHTLPHLAPSQECQIGEGFPPGEACPRPNGLSATLPLVNDLPPDVFVPTTPSPHQVLFDLGNNLARNIEMSRLESSSRSQYFETDLGQPAHPTQLAPPTNADLAPASVLPFSPEPQPIQAIHPTTRRVTRQHVCAHCSNSYPRPYQLRDHIRCKHEDGDKPYCCEHDGCSKAFTTRSNLMRHVRGVHQAVNVSVVTQRSQGQASEASNEPARTAGPSTRRATNPFVVCTPGAMRCRRPRREQ